MNEASSPPASFWVRFGPSLAIFAIVFLLWNIGSIFVFIGDHRAFIGLLFFLLVGLVIAAMMHGAGSIEASWPQNKAPDLRDFVMDLLDKYTSRAKLERLVGARSLAEAFDRDAFVSAMKSSIIGQDETIEEIADSLAIRMAKVSRTKPLGVFLLAGPPATGKTELAKKMAEYLKRGFIFEDMTQCAQKEKAWSLFGASKGYMGSESYGTITGGLRAAPRSVVLLDEIEKAHPQIQTLFLTAWNDGVITEGSNGQKISTTETIFLLTTNAAHEAIERARAGAADADQLKLAVTHILVDAGFKPEVVSRLDDVFVFRPLKGLDVARLAIVQLKRMIETEYDLRLADGGIDATILAQAVERADALQKAGGVRAVVRLLERSLGLKLAHARDMEGAKIIRLALDEGEDISAIRVERVG